MNTIGSHPGAIVFRLSGMFILIAIMVVVFLFYVDKAESEVERKSILQTKKIIDSALTVVFATYAVNHRLDQLNDLNGGNPFVFLEDYQMLPPAYVGEINYDLNDNHESGWYYLTHRKIMVYKSLYSEGDQYFKIVLNYEDSNQSGLFESASDKFLGLQFVKIAEIEGDR